MSQPSARYSMLPITAEVAFGPLLVAEAKIGGKDEELGAFNLTVEVGVAVEPATLTTARQGSVRNLVASAL